MFISKLLFYSICREIVGMSPYFNYVSMILLIFDQLSNLVCNLNTIGGCWYFWKGSWASKAHKPGTLS